MTDTYADGRTGGGRYIQDPVTGALTRELPDDQSPPATATPPVVDNGNSNTDAANGETDKKGSK